MKPIDIFLNDPTVPYSFQRKKLAYDKLILVKHSLLSFEKVEMLFDILKTKTYIFYRNQGIYYRTFRFLLRETSLYYPELFAAILIGLYQGINTWEFLHMINMDEPNLYTKEKRRRKLGYYNYLSDEELAFQHNIYGINYDRETNTYERYYIEINNYTFDIERLALADIKMSNSIYCKLYKYLPYNVDELTFLTEKQKKIIKDSKKVSGQYTKPAIKTCS